MGHFPVSRMRLILGIGLPKEWGHSPSKAPSANPEGQTLMVSLIFQWRLPIPKRSRPNIICLQDNVQKAILNLLLLLVRGPKFQRSISLILKRKGEGLLEGLIP